MSTLQSKCDLVAPLLGALADGEASPAETAFAETHLSACVSCASELAFLRATNRVLSRTPDVFPSAALSARIAQATYARPTTLGRLQAFLRPAPVRVAAGSAALAGLAAIAFVTHIPGGGGENGAVKMVANDRKAKPAAPTLVANHDPAFGTNPDLAKPVTPQGAPTAKSNLSAPTIATAPTPRVTLSAPSDQPKLTEPISSLPASVPNRPERGPERVAVAAVAAVAAGDGDNRSAPRTVAGFAPSLRPRGAAPVSPVAKLTVQRRRDTALLAGGPVASPVQPGASIAPREPVRRGVRKPLIAMPGKIEQPPTLAITFSPRPTSQPEAPAPSAPATPEPVVVASAAPASPEVVPTATRRGGLQLPSLKNPAGTTEILTSGRSRRGGDVASAAGRGDAYEFGVTQGGRVGVVQSPGSL